MRYTERTRRQATAAGRLNREPNWREPELDAGDDWDEDDLETVVQMAAPTISPTPHPRVEHTKKLIQPRILTRSKTPAPPRRHPTPTPPPRSFPRAPSLNADVASEPVSADALPADASSLGTAGRAVLVVAGASTMVLGALAVGLGSVVLATTDQGQKATASISAAVSEGTSSLYTAAPAPAEEPEVVVEEEAPPEAAPPARRRAKARDGAKVVFNDGFKPSDPVLLKLTADTPFVSIHIDGQDVGASPVDVEVQRGTHKIRLAKGQSWGIHELAAPEDGNWCFSVVGEKIAPTDCE